MTRLFTVVSLVLISYSHQQRISTLFNCTFDRGLVDDCIFHGLFPAGDHLESDMGQKSIHLLNRPLSDATSVFTPTTNGEMCQFPYELGGWQLHFCHYDESSTDHLCPTESEQQAKCAQGQYGYKSTSNPAGFLAIYKSNTSIVLNASNEQHCLGFHYYFTDSFRPSNITFRMHPNSNAIKSEPIVTVNPNSENKWYYSQTTFTPIAGQYHLVLVLFRSQAPDDPSNFTFALDDISIINGPCESMANASLTTLSSTPDETSTEPTAVTTYTSGTTATEPAAMTTEQPFVYTDPISTIVSSVITSTTMTTTDTTSTAIPTGSMPFSTTAAGIALTTTETTILSTVIMETSPIDPITEGTTPSHTVTKGTTPTDPVTEGTTPVDSSEAGTTIMQSSMQTTDMISSTTVTTSAMTLPITTTTAVISSTTRSKRTSISVIIGVSVGLGVPVFCAIIIGVIYIVKSKIQKCTFQM